MLNDDDEPIPATQPASGELPDARTRTTEHRAECRRAHVKRAKDWAAAIETNARALDALESIDAAPGLRDDAAELRRAQAWKFVQHARRVVHAAYVQLEEAARELLPADVSLAELDAILAPSDFSPSRVSR